VEHALRLRVIDSRDRLAEVPRIRARAHIRAIEVQPEALAGANTVAAVEPDRARRLP
jgi:hypothetical protein